MMLRLLRGEAQRCTHVFVQPKWQLHRHSSSTPPSTSALGTRGLLRERINAALLDMYSSKYQQHELDMSQFDGVVFPTPKPEKFGDYQCNICMPLAKHLKVKPRDVAAHLVVHLEVNDMVMETTIAGPGFLNFRYCQALFFMKVSQVIHSSYSSTSSVIIEFHASSY
jgi:arginyl-tRNA synthetase